MRIVLANPPWSFSSGCVLCALKIKVCVSQVSKMVWFQHGKQLLYDPVCESDRWYGERRVA